MRTSELFERAAQDDLLLLRGDVMTVLREVSAEDPRLFPLRYARRTPRHPRPVDVAAREQAGVAPPAVPLLVLPDGPGRASVLPYDRLRRGLSARGVDVIMMEHRGVGLSRQDGAGADLPRHAMRLPEVLADVLAVLDHARVERVAVYGAGYGGYLALALAALHGERVASLVLDSPLVTADDELAGQAALRAAYWDGTVPATAATAARLRRLVGSGSVDGRHAGSVVLAVHEHGGPEAVRDLVDLLAVGRGRLTWSSVRQVLAQNWLQSTPYVDEHDLVAPISHTQLGRGHHADGGPLDSLQLLATQGRGLPPFTEEPWALPALAPPGQASAGLIIAPCSRCRAPATCCSTPARRWPRWPGAGRRAAPRRSCRAGRSGSPPCPPPPRTRPSPAVCGWPSPRSATRPGACAWSPRARGASRPPWTRPHGAAAPCACDRVTCSATGPGGPDLPLD